MKYFDTNDTREHGWHFANGKECFGPLPMHAKKSGSMIAKEALARPEVVERRRAGYAAAMAAKHPHRTQAAPPQDAWEEAKQHFDTLIAHTKRQG